MSELLALADRCERSVGPDRQLDGLIWAAMQGVKLITFDCSLTNTEKLSWDGKLKYPNRPGVDYFTASIDAAMTLVPEGWQWQVSNRAPKPHAGRAYIHNRQLHFVGVGLTPNKEYRGEEITAATPALALCAAAIRARAAEVRG